MNRGTDFVEKKEDVEMMCWLKQSLWDNNKKTMTNRI